MHRDIEPILEAYFDGEVSDSTRERVELHLRSCEKCLGKVKHLERLREGFAAAAKVPPSEIFVQGVIRAVQDRENSRPAAATPFFLRWLFPTLGYACAVILMFAAIASRQTPVS